MTSIVEIHNLSKTYDGNLILDNLNLTIEQGQIIGLLGRNGAGKTTLIESIMGLKDLKKNCIHIWQQPINELKKSQLQSIAFVPQNQELFEWMKVNEYFDYFSVFFEKWDNLYAQQLLNRWNLNSTKKISELSGGQKQILQIVQALSVKPKLLILDEPVVNLDPNMRREFLKEIVDLSCESNITVLFSTHIISDVERIASHIALLNNGKIEIFDAVETIQTHAASVVIQGTITNKEQYNHLTQWEDFDQGHKAVMTQKGNHSISQIECENNVTIQSIPMSLEDWYLEVTRA
ncbi:ABC transporter ATP-binding protein [Marinicellulosiphila megalodicopiae]|uniref:ABC transporter ATP-binding protein n=1 Tax=Marinicellulosiphila megalodicopiae TaxID=2724896 RepID=UPI003BB1D302